MSLRALTWAFDLDVEDLTSTLTLVLITLANYANEEDETYPRQSTIAKKTKLSRQTEENARAFFDELRSPSFSGRAVVSPTTSNPTRRSDRGWCGTFHGSSSS